MPYTHYFLQKRDFTEKEFEQLVEFAEQAIYHAEIMGIKICGSWGISKPGLCPISISLNGSSEEQLHCDSFCIYSNAEIASKICPFCKTARKPYDIVVTAILWYIHQQTPGVMDITSDVTFKTDCNDGIALYE